MNDIVLQQFSYPINRVAITIHCLVQEVVIRTVVMEQHLLWTLTRLPFKMLVLLVTTNLTGCQLLRCLTQHNRFLQVQKFITVLGMYDCLQVKLSTSHRMDSSI